MSYKESEVFLAHRNLGFPKIDKENQLKILITRDNSPIISLLPKLKNKGFPLGLLNEYITVSKLDLKDHFRKINFIQSQLDKYHSTSDGFWLRKKQNEFEFFERERGNEFGHKILKTEDEVLDIYTGIIGWCCK